MGGSRAYPSLLRSMMAGNMECRYVEVQMRRRMIKSKLWKLKRAVCGGRVSRCQAVPCAAIHTMVAFSIPDGFREQGRSMGAGARNS